MDSDAGHKRDGDAEVIAWLERRPSWQVTSTELDRPASHVARRVVRGRRAVVTRYGHPECVMVAAHELVILLKVARGAAGPRPPDPHRLRYRFRSFDPRDNRLHRAVIGPEAAAAELRVDKGKLVHGRAWG